MQQPSTTIRLEPFTEADFSDLIRWIDTEEKLVTWSGSLFQFPLTDASLCWYIEETNVPFESTAFVYKPVLANGTCIGHISLGGLSWKNRSARISRVLVAPEFQGSGYCKPMMEALLAIGFGNLNLHRIELGVYAHNTAAIRCYESAGFQVEGIQRDVILKEDGSWWSRAEMSILQPEWVARQTP